MSNVVENLKPAIYLKDGKKIDVVVVHGRVGPIYLADNGDRLGELFDGREENFVWACLNHEDLQGGSMMPAPQKA